MFKLPNSFGLGNRALLGMSLAASYVGRNLLCEGIPSPVRMAFVYSYSYNADNLLDVEVEEPAPLALSA